MKKRYLILLFTSFWLFFAFKSSISIAVNIDLPDGVMLVLWLILTAISSGFVVFLIWHVDKLEAKKVE